jgi:hypothetical protein
MDDAFGVYPDGQKQPAALFHDLEDAITWGLARYGQDRFAIRYCPVVVALRGVEERRTAAC